MELSAKSALGSKTGTEAASSRHVFLSTSSIGGRRPIAGSQSHFCSLRVWYVFARHAQTSINPTERSPIKIGDLPGINPLYGGNDPAPIYFTFRASPLSAVATSKSIASPQSSCALYFLKRPLFSSSMGYLRPTICFWNDQGLLRYSGLRYKRALNRPIRHMCPAVDNDDDTTLQWRRTSLRTSVVLAAIDAPMFICPAEAY